MPIKQLSGNVRKAVKYMRMEFRGEVLAKLLYLGIVSVEVVYKSHETGSNVPEVKYRN